MAAKPALPEGIFSLLDTDLYKLTMQCCILKYFPTSRVEYKFTNRTPELKLSRGAYKWLKIQIKRLAKIALQPSELAFLRKQCPFLEESYLSYISTFRFSPDDHVKISFRPDNDRCEDSDLGEIQLYIAGLWVDTILYEIPLLALVSEAYFKFCQKDWNHDGQLEKARDKGVRLLKGGCIFSEFGTRRRRDYHTQDLVIRGLCEADELARAEGWGGKLSGTSNVHFALRYRLQPVGTVAHEWFMGIAAIMNDYDNASEIALKYWIWTFGQGVLGIALTDTFGTTAFLDAFKLPVPAESEPPQTLESSANANASAGAAVDGTSETRNPPTYAEVFSGVRQDSGDPLHFIKLMRRFYDSQVIKEKKTMVFSDSLNIDLCLKYKAAAEEADFQPTFGIGTFLTNDFVETTTGKPSSPPNIVIKLQSACGRSAVKISDSLGKNTGDEATVAYVKQKLGYVEKEWDGGDESKRWDPDR